MGITRKRRIDSDIQVTEEVRSNEKTWEIGFGGQASKMPEPSWYAEQQWYFLD